MFGCFSNFLSWAGEKLGFKKDINPKSSSVSSSEHSSPTPSSSTTISNTVNILSPNIHLVINNNEVKKTANSQTSTSQTTEEESKSFVDKGKGSKK